MDRQPVGTGHVQGGFGLVVITLVLLGWGATAFAQPDGSQGRTLEGVWAVTSTPRDCTTGATLGPPVRALLTFHQGGTVTESLALLIAAPGQRSIGHGVWSHAGGLTYIERTVAMIQFDGGPFLAGWSLSARTDTLTDANNFTAIERTSLYDINRQFLREICAARVGERFR